MSVSIEFKAKMASGGRVVVPQWLRDAAALDAGDIVILTYHGKVKKEAIPG